MFLRLNELHETATPVEHAAENTQTTDPADSLRRLFDEQRGAFGSAARLLAGPQGARLVEEISDRLQQPGPMPRRNLFALRQLLGILSLENVHDQDRPEARLFACLDPLDPVVEEICLLTDSLRDALECADAAPAPASCPGRSCNKA